MPRNAKVKGEDMGYSPADLNPPKPSIFLKAGMIGFDRELTLTIDRVEQEEFEYRNEKKMETIVYWREGILGKCHPKSIALKGFKTNKTQRNALFKMLHGPKGKHDQDTDHWIGKRVTLTMDIGEMNGEDYETIVVKKARPGVPPNPWLVDDYGRPLPIEMQPEGFIPDGGLPEGTTPTSSSKATPMYEAEEEAVGQADGDLPF